MGLVLGLGGTQVRLGAGPEMRCRFSKDSFNHHLGIGLGRARRSLQGPKRVLGQVSPERGWHQGNEFGLADLAVLSPEIRNLILRGVNREVYIKWLLLNVLVASVQGKTFLKKKGYLEP